MKVYLDNAATTAIRTEVAEAMMPFLAEHYGNPSSIHGLGRVTKTAIEKARKTVAELLNTSPAEIFFTSGGTEANNMILKGAVEYLGVTDIISSEAEHHCVYDVAKLLQDTRNTRIHYVNLDEKGHVDPGHLEQLLKAMKGEGKALVSLMHANNEIGNLLDLERVGALCKEHGAYCHSDTVQSVAHYSIDLQSLPVDFITGSAHKFHGPKGTGFAYVNHALDFGPFVHGGSQERNMRAGTENLLGIIGLGKAIELAYRDLEEDQAYITDLKMYMASALQEQLEDITFNGDYADRSLYTVLNVAFPKHEKSSLLLFNLDIAGICASSGSACSSGSDVGSHVLKAIGADPERTAIRFSFSRFTTKEDIDYTVSTLKSLFSVPSVVN